MGKAFKTNTKINTASQNGYKKTSQEGPDFPTKTVSFLWHFLARHKRQFVPITILMLFWSANEALYPYFVKMIVDAVSLFEGDKSSFWPKVLTPFCLLIGSFVLMEVAMRITFLMQVFAFPKLRADMRTKVTAYVKDHDLGYFINSLSGNLANRVHDIPKATHDLIEAILDDFIAVVFSFLFMLVVLWLASPLFSIILFIWVTWHMGVTAYYFKELTTKSKDHADKVSKLQGVTVDFITNILTVRLFARGKRELAKLRESQDEEIAYSIRSGLAYQKVNLLRGIGGLFFVGFTIYFLIHGWIQGWVTTGDFPLVTMITLQMLGQIWHLSMTLQGMFRNYGIIDSALQICRRSHHVVDKPEARDLRVYNGAITFENVMFHYKKSTPLFSELSVTIKGGEKVGLVGFSGSGKTSFVNLLLRFYDIQSGKITIDDQDITDVTQSSLRRHISMIPQDPSLFHRTVKENLCVGNPDASDEDIIAAAKQSHCHDFIENLDQGYKTILGERGLKLSGGQRQRIAIARAIIKDAPILIMDEATSALDSSTENHIQNSLDHIMQGRTVMVVAHRLSTLANLDRILVFDQGRIVEDGTINDLLNNENGIFYQLWHLQNNGFLPEKRPS